MVDSLENKNAELADVNSAKESLEPEESYLDRYRIASNKTSLISNILEIPEEVDKEGVVSVAPREGKKPMSIFADKYCEELAFPHLFLTWKFGWTSHFRWTSRQNKIFNQSWVSGKR